MTLLFQIYGRCGGTGQHEHRPYNVSARDFPARQGETAKAYGLYVEPVLTPYCRKRSADLLSGGLIDQGHFYIAIAPAVIERKRDAVPGGKLVLDAVQLVD